MNRLSQILISQPTFTANDVVPVYDTPFRLSINPNFNGNTDQKLLTGTDTLDPNVSGIPTWDGFYQGKAMDPAVFVYLVEIEFEDGLKLLYRKGLSVHTG